MQQLLTLLGTFTMKFVVVMCLFIFGSGVLLGFVLFSPTYRDMGSEYAPDDERPAPCQQPRPAKKQNPCHVCGRR